MKTTPIKYLWIPAVIFALFMIIGSSLKTDASTIPNTPAFTSDSLSTGIGKTDTAISLVRGTDGQGSQLAGYYGFVIDEGTASQEVIACTANGALLTACVRGLDLRNGTTSVASLELVHRRGASVKVTTFPIIGILAQIFQGINGLPNLIHYDSGIDCSAGHATNVLCSGSYLENYANNVISGGAPTSTQSVGGKVLLGTLAQQAASFDGGVTAPTVLQTKNATSSCQVVGPYAIIASTTTGKMDKGCFDQTLQYNLTGSTTISAPGGFLVTASSTFVGTTTQLGKTVQNIPGQNFTSASTTTSWPMPMIVATSTGLAFPGISLNASSTINFIGFTQTNATQGQPVFVQTSGVVSGFSGLSVGSDYYLQDGTGATIGTTPGTFEGFVGTAISSTQLLLNRNMGMQYMGSVGVSHNVGFNIPPYVREIVINATVNGGTGSPLEAELTLFRNGKTAGTFFSDTVIGGASRIIGQVSCSISGNTGTCTGTFTNGGASQTPISLTATAYFYR